MTLPTEIHYRLTEMPDDLALRPGSTVEVIVTDVTDLDDGAIEVVLRYIGYID
jgi:hypothetical protein